MNYRCWMIALLFCCGISVVAQNNASGKEQLTHAMEYFSSGKYHEALLLFQKLDKKYDLNPRFHAYMGVCYYYDWEYKKACEYLDEAIPKLDAYAPHERSVYYYAAAESHFNLEQYAEALRASVDRLFRQRKSRRAVSHRLLLSFCQQ